MSLLLLNTHLDIGPESVRTRSVSLIAERVRALRTRNEPVIVCGDMNAAPGTTAYRVFERNGFRDSFAETGHEDLPEQFTAHLSMGPKYTPSMYGYESSRIDQIWAQGPHSAVSPISYTVISDNVDGQYPSDHYPVLVEFELGQPQPK